MCVVDTSKFAQFESIFESKPQSAFESRNLSNSPSLFSMDPATSKKLAPPRPASGPNIGALAAEKSHTPPSWLSSDQSTFGASTGDSLFGANFTTDTKALNDAWSAAPTVVEGDKTFNSNSADIWGKKGKFEHVYKKNAKVDLGK